MACLSCQGTVWQGTSRPGTAENGRKAVVTVLIERGANITAEDEFGNQAIHSAAFGGDEDVVRLLIAKGASVKARCKSGYTPLHCAADRGQVKIGKLLIAKG